jgi:hypothetical protein
VEGSIVGLSLPERLRVIDPIIRPAQYLNARKFPSSAGQVTFKGKPMPRMKFLLAQAKLYSFCMFYLPFV